MDLINSFVEDYFSSLNENPFPVVFILNAILILGKLTILLDGSFYSELSHVDFLQEENTNISLDVIIIILLSVSCINLWKMCHCFKEYILLHQPTTGQYPEDESYKIRSPNASIILTDVQNDMTKKVRRRAWMSSQTWEKEVKFQEKWQIKVWDPSNLELKLATYLSPLQILLVYNMDYDNFWISLLLVIVNNFTMDLITNLWSGRLRDQSIVSGQVLKEFTDGFVYKLPKFSVRKESASQN